MNFKAFFVILFVVTSFSSCNSQTPGVKRLKPDEFQKGIATAGVQLVDVRTPEEYSEKHIAGAININEEGPDFDKQLNELDKHKPIYVYCKSGGRSKKAAAAAVKDGFSDVNSLDGGISSWESADKPVTNLTGELTESGLSFDEYLTRIKNPDKLVLVDFNAVWCGPCKMMKPIVTKEVKKNSDKVELFEVDVDKNPKVASTMNITGIPLLILYKNGKEVWRSMGLIDENELAGN